MRLVGFQRLHENFKQLDPAFGPIIVRNRGYGVCDRRSQFVVWFLEWNTVGISYRYVDDSKKMSRSLSDMDLRERSLTFRPRGRIVRTCSFVFAGHSGSMNCSASTDQWTSTYCLSRTEPSWRDAKSKFGSRIISHKWMAYSAMRLYHYAVKTRNPISTRSASKERRAHRHGSYWATTG